MRPTACPETSVLGPQNTPHDIPEDRRPLTAPRQKLENLQTYVIHRSECLDESKYCRRKYEE